MEKDLAHEAITLALTGNWPKAVETNLIILQDNPNDIDALNRLARAYAETGSLPKARITAQKVLKIDPFNTIANKSLGRWKGLKKGDTYASRPLNPQLFLEEPGKTKIVELLYLGSPEILAKLDAGDEVKLNTHSHRVCVDTYDGNYIGRLPDNLSARLRRLINLGNEYLVFIKSVDKNDVKIFIRESKRSDKLTNVASFSSEKIDYISFTPPELVHRKDEIDVNLLDEEEDN